MVNVDAFTVHSSNLKSRNIVAGGTTLHHCIAGRHHQRHRATTTTSRFLPTTSSSSSRCTNTALFYTENDNNNNENDDLVKSSSSSQTNRNYKKREVVMNTIIERNQQQDKKKYTIPTITASVGSTKERLQAEIMLLESLEDSNDGIMELTHIWNSGVSGGNYDDFKAMMNLEMMITMSENNPATMMEAVEMQLCDIIMENDYHWYEPIHKLAMLYSLQENYNDAYQLYFYILTNKPWHIGAIHGFLSTCQKLLYNSLLRISTIGPKASSISSAPPRKVLLVDVKFWTKWTLPPLPKNLLSSTSSPSSSKSKTDYNDDELLLQQRKEWIEHMIYIAEDQLAMIASRRKMSSSNSSSKNEFHQLTKNINNKKDTIIEQCDLLATCEECYE